MLVSIVIPVHWSSNASTMSIVDFSPFSDSTRARLDDREVDTKFFGHSTSFPLFCTAATQLEKFRLEFISDMRRIILLLIPLSLNTQCLSRTQCKKAKNLHKRKDAKTYELRNEVEFSTFP